MALYTPPSLPHTPYNMDRNSTLLPLPTELFATWEQWRQPKHEMPLTPPLSVPPRRADRPQVTVLPPIAHLDRHLNRLSPLTPQDDIPIASSSRLQPVSSTVSDMDDYQQGKPSIPSPAPHLVDWFSTSQKRSAHFIAEKTCEMICYLWFANNPTPPTKSSLGSSSRQQSSSSCPFSTPYIPSSNPATASLQLVATPAFVTFMQKLLETTQVSQSVIVLSLHYIYRLKARNRYTNGQPGSEFRVAVAALMMANKFVDDNTYTNKTWSEISSITLSEINKMEREFLLGVDFDLYVDKPTYESWLNLLKGLVMAKEKESRKWHRGRGKEVRALGRPSVASVHRPSTQARHDTNGRGRARSTSPIQSSRQAAVYANTAYHPFTFALPPLPSTAPRSLSSHPSPDSPYSSAMPSGSKRSAADAFSPTSVSFATSLHPPRPLKRPASKGGLSLEIPDYGVGGPMSANGKGVSPMESLQGFAKLSLGSEGANTPSQVSASTSHQQPQTLAAAYRSDVNGRHAPHNLYYYSLACSPLEEDISSDVRSRKAKLRVHQNVPPPSSGSYYSTSELASCPYQQQQQSTTRSAYPSSSYAYSFPSRVPLVVQSASTSPDMVMGDVGSLALPPPPQIKRYDEEQPDINAWRRGSLPGYSSQSYSRSPCRMHEQQQQPLAPVHELDYYRSQPHYSNTETPEVPSAPFANAGPPGVQFYAPSQQAVSLQPPTHLLQYRPSQQYDPVRQERPSPDLTYFQWPSDRGRRLHK